MYQKIFNEMIMLISNKYTPDSIVKEVRKTLSLKVFITEDFLNRAIDFILNAENKLDFGYIVDKVVKED